LMKKKKVLIISYLFPPEVGGSGVLRVIKFIKWLRRLGWEPVVLTVIRHDTFMPDPTFLKEIDGVKVFKCHDYFRGIIRYLLIKLNTAKNKALGHSSSSGQETKEGKQGLLKRLIYDLICIPDECFGWIIPAIMKGRKIIMDEDISVIYATSPSISAHFIGSILKRKCGIPLVLDVCDGWVENPEYRSYLPGRENINKKIESRIVEDSDRVITVTEGLARYYRNNYNSKVSLIFNGYDEDDFNFEPPARENNDKLIFSFFGRLRYRKSLESFILAVERVDKDVLDDVEIKFIGKISDENEICIKQSKVSKHIIIRGHLSHQSALKMMFQSDVLIIILSSDQDSNNILTAKIFEYIRTGRTIFAMCPRNSELWNFINKHDLGICAESTDVEGIQEALIFLHRKWKEGTLDYNSSPLLLEEFNRKKLTRQLIDIFDEVTIPGNNY